MGPCTEPASFSPPACFPSFSPGGDAFPIPRERTGLPSRLVLVTVPRDQPLALAMERRMAKQSSSKNSLLCQKKVGE